MTSFEPIVLVFGSSASIGAVSLRLPVSFIFAFDTESLEQLVNANAQLSDTCLQRYFVVLLDSIDGSLLARLEANYRVQTIRSRDMICDNSQRQLDRLAAQQLALDLTNDIVQFLTKEGEKQAKLERISLVKIYYQQARQLKEWAMSFAKAEPCHILLIPLNSSQENLDTAQQRLQKICTKLGYTSVTIRQLNDYIPNNAKDSSLMPYAKLLFNNDDPYYMCQLIKKLSPVRLYLYGNMLCSPSEWSKLMIATETEIMDDEDNWCAFLENEYVDHEVKWNFAFVYGREWRVSRVSPLDLCELDENPRFQSALHRAHITFGKRQIEVTTEIFDWYAKCIEKGYLRIEPQMTPQQQAVKYNSHRQKHDFGFLRKHPFRHLSSFDYLRLNIPKVKSISFIWLDEILQDSDDEFHRIVKPFQWEFFDKVSNCVSFIEKQLRKQRYIFLIVSGSLGDELFLAGLCLMKQMFAIYIYCAELGPHLNWSRNYSQIRGVYNDPTLLANLIKQDFDQLQLSLGVDETKWYTSPNTTEESQVLLKVEDMESPFPLPVTVYDREQAHLFMAHQRTIDTILCMPHTSESRAEMLDEFRRAYSDNEVTLVEIDNFGNTYHSNAAVQWYTRDSFVWRTINQALRSSNVDAMFKLRYILTDLYAHLNESYKQKRSYLRQAPAETLYRGQLMSSKEFNSFKELRGSIISINTFLSTTTSMQVALTYAGKHHENPDLIAVVFTIETDPQAQQTRPYANISHYSMFQDEDEVLFSMGSVFRIGNVRQLPSTDNVWTISLKMIDQQGYQFN